MGDGPWPAWRADVLAAAGVRGTGAPWQPLRGGRVNRVWRVPTTEGAVAVKHYGVRVEGGLFPNRPEAELAALAAGWRDGRAPEPLCLASTRAGPVLVYRYLPSQHPVCPEQAGRALAGLHGATPWPELAPLEPGRWRLSAAALHRLRRHGLSADARAAITAAATRSRRLRCDPAPVHGDPVPANILATASGPVLIDWQCPGFGDGATDLALYLSPAMQTRYGAGPLGLSAQRLFRRAYGSRRVLVRYDRLAPLLHARIAIHCAAQGDAAALAAEIALLNRLARGDGCEGAF